MKTCSRCRAEKSDDEFTWKNKSRAVRAAYCRTCQRAYQKDHYAQDKNQYLKRNARSEERRYAWINKLKSSPCVDCGKSYPPCAMEFDHRDGDTKVATVSEMLHAGTARAKVVAEIAKCDLVCVLCHRLRTCRRSHRFCNCMPPQLEGRAAVS